MSLKRYLAIDFGAESGRAIVGTLENGKLTLEEIHRFLNEPAMACETMHWDILALYNNIIKGMREYVKRYGPTVDGIGVDTWGVDFGILGPDGILLQNPVCYRDKRTEGMVEKVHEKMSDRELFNHTGISTLNIHTLFQFMYLNNSDSPLFDCGTRYLMMPDLFNYFLSGAQVCERSDAITTQLYDPRRGDWSREVFETLDYPLHIMPELVDPGTVLGGLRPSVSDITGLTDAQVIAVCGHDTGAAVAAVPAEGADWAFISSGTWSILGALSPEVVTTDAAYEGRIVNELTAGSLFLARNIMGLWLLQRCRAAWTEEGQQYAYEDLAKMAAEAPADGPVVYPDHLSFLAPLNMPQAICEYCIASGQTPPADVPGMVRCIMDSLALIYREATEQIGAALGKKLNAIHIVGGGSQNRLLCQLTADAAGVPVYAGPVEATVCGNVLVQALALGDVSSPEEIREIVRNSFDLITYEPKDRANWDAKYEFYRSLPR